jgi:hypothetical protein
MSTLSVPALKSIIVGLGYPEIQNVNTTTFNVFVKTPKEVLAVPPIIFRAIKPFEPKFVSSNKKPYNNPEDSYIEVGNLKVYVKHQKNKKIPKKLTLGRNNEQNFYIIIKEHLKIYEKFNIEFQENGGTQFLVKDVVNVVKTGKNIKDRKKGDINLVTSTHRKIPISLKQSDAPYWETPDTYWGETAKNVLEYALAKGKINLVPYNNVYRLSNEIAIMATKEEAHDLIFGNDIYGQGAIIKQTWNYGYVRWDDAFKTLFLQCKSVILEVEDVPPEDKPYFQIRNHKDKNSKYLYPGLMLLAVRKELTKKNQILPEEARPYQEWKKVI